MKDKATARLFVALPVRVRPLLDTLTAKTGRTRGKELERLIERACKELGIKSS